MGAAELGEGGAGAEGLADVVGEGADVGAFGAGDLEVDVGGGVGAEGEVVDVDELGGAGDGLAFAGEFVEGDAVDFDGGYHRRGLHLVAEAGVHLGGDLVGGDGGGVAGGDDLAVGVLGVGFDAEAEDAFVGFVVAHDALGDFGGFAEQDDEEAGGHGVEGAAVADFGDAELAADFCDDVVGGPAGGFVHQQEAIEGVKRNGRGVGHGGQGAGGWASWGSWGWGSSRTISPLASIWLRRLRTWSPWAMEWSRTKRRWGV